MKQYVLLTVYSLSWQVVGVRVLVWEVPGVDLIAILENVNDSWEILCCSYSEDYLVWVIFLGH